MCVCSHMRRRESRSKRFAGSCAHTGALCRIPPQYEVFMICLMARIFLAIIWIFSINFKSEHIKEIYGPSCWDAFHANKINVLRSYAPITCTKLSPLPTKSIELTFSSYWFQFTWFMARHLKAVMRRLETQSENEFRFSAKNGILRKTFYNK